MRASSQEYGPRLPGILAKLVFGTTLLMLPWLAGCGQVDASQDFQATARLIQERTGIQRVYQPGLGQVALEQITAELLKGGLTAEEAAQVALLRNPKLQAAFQEVGISKAELVLAGLPRNPLFFISTRFPEGGGMVNVTTSISQSISDLFLLGVRKSIGRARLEAARLGVAQEAIALINRVKHAAFDLLALKRSQKVVDHQLDLVTHSLALAHRRLRAGESDIIEVNLARSALLEMQRERLLLGQDLAIGRIALGQFLGIQRSRVPWKLVDKLPGPVATDKESTLQELARNRRLDVRIAHLHVQAAEAEFSREGGLVVPDLALGFERERSEAPPSLNGPTLEGSLPLWNQNAPGLARARFRVIQARKHLADVQDLAARDLHLAMAQAHGSGSLVRLFEREILPQAERNLTSARKAWQAGRHDILVVIEAQRFLMSQRRVYVQTLRAYAKALADLEKAVGGRFPESDTSRPPPSRTPRESDQ